MTFNELCAKIYKHNKENNITRQFEDKNPMICRITFSNKSWMCNGKASNYSYNARTYEFRSDNKYFLGSMGGTSIYASSLDGKDEDIRLDWYLKDWIIEDCTIKEE